MKYGSLVIEKKEYVYLKRILNISRYVDDNQVRRSLLKLFEKLKIATIVDDNDVPKDVVRLNSIVSVKSDKGWERILQVVIPKEKDLSLNKVSVLAPMGAALYGCSKGDIIDWNFPGGKQKLIVIDIKKTET